MDSGTIIPTTPSQTTVPPVTTLIVLSEMAMLKGHSGPAPVVDVRDTKALHPPLLE
jgi:hypothetical protein